MLGYSFPEYPQPQLTSTRLEVVVRMGWAPTIYSIATLSI
jgi:hypothetical protein